MLPGVGAAAPAMRALRAARPGRRDPRRAAAGARLLGVCLGMQLLFERSAEGDVDCLGLLPGTGRAGSAGRGGCRTWAGTTSWRRPTTRSAGGLPAVCYFAHSYAVVPADRPAVVAETEVDGRAVRRAVVGAAAWPACSSTPRRAARPAGALLGRWLADAA